MYCTLVTSMYGSFTQTAINGIIIFLLKEFYEKVLIKHVK